jgi:hypothetical protein
MNIDDHRRMRITADNAQLRELEMIDLLKKKEK